MISESAMSTLIPQRSLFRAKPAIRPSLRVKTEEAQKKTTSGEERLHSQFHRTKPSVSGMSPLGAYQKRSHAKGA
jgi:hypothetical protein